MRRQLLFISILLIALTVSGWGGVIAVALCPHAARASAADAAPTPMKMDDDHACCPVKSAMTADEHCSNSSHQAKGEMEAMHRTTDEPRSLAQLAESCWHCVRHNSLPGAPLSMRDAQQNGSEASRAASQEVKPISPPAARFVSAINPVQGAPPGQPIRKHLIFSVFLI
jgi:hypothetical protein